MPTRVSLAGEPVTSQFLGGTMFDTGSWNFVVDTTWRSLVTLSVMLGAAAMAPPATPWS